MSKQINKYLATLPFYRKKILCKAPYTSLRLCLNGNIQVCCVNKEFLLGKYPEISIKDAWFGKKISQLRKCIADKDLSLGCAECNSQIEMNAFSSVKARLYNHLTINKNGYPSLIEFELDNNCNLECIMCNPHTSSAILKNCHLNNISGSPYDLSLLNEIEEFIPHLTHANFIGGEPFLISLYYSIIEKMLSINPHIIFNISTNGTILNNNLKELLSRGQFDIGISIDSIIKETYEKIRKNASFETTFENLNYFHSYCKTKKSYFSVWVCPIKQNAYEIPDFVKYFEKRNIPVYFNTVTMPHSLSLWYQKPEDLKSIRTFYQENIILGKSLNAKRFNDLLNQIRVWEIAAVQREKNIEPFTKLSSEGLKNTYLLQVTQYIKSQSLTSVDIENINLKINRIMLNKNEIQLKDIFLFLLSIPVPESLDIVLSNDPEYINYYIANYF